MTIKNLSARLASLQRPFRLVVTGGGTGGHTYPALTAVREMQTRLHAHGATLDTLWVGAAEGLEARVAPAEGIPFKTVPTGKLRRSANPLRMLSPDNMRDMGRVPKGLVEARSILAEYRADVVLATGGYVAVPAGLAAKMTRTPLVVHEQTVRLGVANRVLSRIATAIALSSDSTLKVLSDSAAESAVVIGNPVRPAIFTGTADKARTALGLTDFDPALPTVYVTGGAQGSVQINAMVRDALPWLLQAANVIHQCGATDLEASREHADALPAAVRSRYWLGDFIGQELPDVLALSDVVISRSGAGIIAELTALGKPAILVPLSTSAGNEQEHNARHLHRAGAAVALMKDQADEGHLRQALEPLLTSPQDRAHMAKKAESLGRPDAASRLVDLLLDTGLG